MGIVGLECTKIGESGHGEESIKGKVSLDLILYVLT